MGERKVNNYDSVILRDMTFEKEGYYPEHLGKKSAKYVWATCRYCGEPSRLQKCSYNKSSSACHRACCLEEQKILSPFRDPEINKKAQKNIDREASGKKISETKRTEESRKKLAATNLLRYGVVNVFQADSVKFKIAETLSNRFGVTSPIKADAVREKVATTLRTRYGVDNICHIDGVQEKRENSFSEFVSNNADRFEVISALRDDDFWQRIENKESLRNVCYELGISYESTATTLSREEFRERFRSTYSYPKFQQQKEIMDFIKGLGVSVIFNDKNAIAPLELDIYIPEKRIAIEFNGSFWHSEAWLEPSEARHKHMKKTKLCRQINVRLIHIFEHHWIHNKHQTCSFIKSALGCNLQRIAARKCHVRNSPSEILFDTHHMQGAAPSVLQTFNLVNNDTVLGSMTASKHHRQDISGNPIVLSRLCFAENHTVQGGASKLFKRFCEWGRDNGYDRVISWSNTCWTEGGIYVQLGFDLAEEHGPDYFYYDVKSKEYRSKQSQKKKTTKCPPDLTEREWCMQRGLYRIWDCGKKRWEFVL